MTLEEYLEKASWKLVKEGAGPKTAMVVAVLHL